MAQVVSAVDLGKINLSSIEGELENTESEFSSVENGANLLSVLSNFPPLTQVMPFYFLIHIFFPQVNSIPANLITPVVESYLDGNEKTDRQK